MVRPRNPTATRTIGASSEDGGSSLRPAGSAPRPAPGGADDASEVAALVGLADVDAADAVALALAVACSLGAVTAVAVGPGVRDPTVPDAFGPAEAPAPVTVNSGASSRVPGLPVNVRVSPS